ncbi:MAG: glycyl-radical enzyme activating protein [Desulfobacteraceae bacterium]|nr:glycyl-radical enzyme activating protein [Desulfobacteraceae bacterium]
MGHEKRSDDKHGFVFNIQRYSLHDGPGIRTIVFLKGCPLRCQWCSNPESQKVSPEVALNSRKCIGTKECGFCARECRDGAIIEKDDGQIRIDRNACSECFRCVDACPSKAMTLFGRLMSVDEVLRNVEADGIFYGRSGGGMTLSGGEPLMQPGFARELLKEARRRRINTSLETCGFVDWKVLEAACFHLDTILFDIKSMDPVKHKAFTGVTNELILDNFERLCREFPNLSKRVRTPVVPGFNDTMEEIGAIVDFIKGRPNIEYEMLAYHRYGQPKYEYLDRVYTLSDVHLDDGRMSELRGMAKERLGKLALENEPTEPRVRMEAPCATCGS